VGLEKSKRFRKRREVEMRRIVFLVITTLLVVGLVLPSCAGGGDGGDGNGDEVEIPQYGGGLTIVVGEDPTYFDDAIGGHYQTTGPYECLWSGDWAKGIAGGYGTSECEWLLSGALNRLEHKTGYIAESYEIHDDYLIFNIRPGVKFHDKFPCNGREVTADDVVFSLERQRTLETAWLKRNWPLVAAAMSIFKVDEDTVRIDCSSHQRMAELLTLIDFMYIYPRDVIEFYGDMNGWERAIGTGAFTLEEYVEGDYLYYEKNPNYWETNPVGPGEGDPLPYLGSVRTLIQPDISTQDSLFTTSQVDIITCDANRAQALKDLPGVEYVRFFDVGGNGVIYMRTDKEDKPWADVRVRQALQLAIDNQQMLDTLYGGDGEILYWPVYYCKEYVAAYVPLEDLEDDMIEVLPGQSISVADLFGYNPELAKELLADAGYPEGFWAEISCWNSYTYLDPIQMVVDYWEDIGVDLTIHAVDFDLWMTQQTTRSYGGMLYGPYAAIGTYLKGINWWSVGVGRYVSMFNASYINDPVLNDYRDQMLAAYPDEEECDRIHCEMLPYLLEQCYVLQMSVQYTYRFWWPWVKNYSGEGSVGYFKGLNPSNSYAYVWIDQELKEEMGHGD